MPYSLHFVPVRRTTQVLLTLAPPGGMGQPMVQKTWPNCVRMMLDLGQYLDAEQVARARAHLLAGRSYWVPEIYLSDAEIDEIWL